MSIGPTKTIMELVNTENNEINTLINNANANRMVSNKKLKTIVHQKVKSVPLIPPIDISSQSHFITSLFDIKNNDSNNLTKTQTKTQSTKQITMLNSNKKKKKEIHHNLHYRNNRNGVISPSDLEYKDRCILSESNVSDCIRPNYQSVMENDNRSLRNLIDQCALQISNGETLVTEIGYYSKAKLKHIEYKLTYNNSKLLKTESELHLELLKEDINERRKKMKECIRNKPDDLVLYSKSLENINKNNGMNNEKDMNRKNKVSINRKKIETLLEKSIKSKQIIIRKADKEEERKKKELKELELLKKIKSLSIPKLKRITLNKVSSF